MRNLLRFVLPLLLVLAGLAWVAAEVLERTHAGWLRTDLHARAEWLAGVVVTATPEAWRAEDAALRRELERAADLPGVLAVAALGPGDEVLAEAGPRATLEAALAGLQGVAGPRRAEVRVGGAPRLASRVPVDGAHGRRGSLVLVQDLGATSVRGADVRVLTWTALGALAALAALATLAAVRLTWRAWTSAMRGLLSGEEPEPTDPALARALRKLIEASLEDRAGLGGPWDAERLRRSLRLHLHGERLVLLANREPYLHERKPSGEVVVHHPASGLVTALEPVMRACSGTWVAHGSGSADRQAVDAHDRVRVPPGDPRYVLRRVWLTPEEEQGYYYGFANEGLWPLCHIAHIAPIFRASDWRRYGEVNRRFADAVAEESGGDDPIVLVQDYHFALAPQAVRRRLPQATILSFWHIPWPNAERFAICPWHIELLEGLLGSSIVGFHTQQHCHNFLDAVDRYLEARIDREEGAVWFGGRRTLVRAYPISIEWPTQAAAAAPPVEDCRRRVCADLGLPPGTLLGVGVDRIDYTKGLEERVLAVEQLLERHPQFRGRFCFVQLAAPSRTAIPAYRELNERLEAAVARLQQRFGRPRWRPFILLREHHEPDVVARYYRAADVCYVSSLHDGMNLVAKEFVAARDDLAGVLVLSRFTGAARELSQALLVNPYDIEAVGEALAQALTMPAAQQRLRMRAMRSHLSDFNVYRWAGRLVRDAAELRRAGRRAAHVAPEESLA